MNFYSKKNQRFSSTPPRSTHMVYGTNLMFLAWVDPKSTARHSAKNMLNHTKLNLNKRFQFFERKQSQLKKLGSKKENNQTWWDEPQ